MKLSIWEKESFFKHRDIIIVGAGLSGLWSAYHLKKRNPSLSIAIVERGLIPTGASTRNAGFACFGSLTELLHDQANMGDDKTLELVSMRYQGLQQIMQTFNPAEIGFTLSGGYELITDTQSRDSLNEGLEKINNLLASVIPSKQTFVLANEKIGRFGFQGVTQLIENSHEGYLHAGKLCQLLLQIVQASGVTVLNGINVTGYTKINGSFNILTEQQYELSATRLLICTNAFAKDLISGIDIIPARGQVLLTNPIPGLKWKGTFHAEEGFYYFRNLDSRVLLGGARNQDIKSENSEDMVTTPAIQQALEYFLQKYIIPGVPYTISDRWSGIMAMGNEKMPIIREIEEGLFCAVRMSGMGVALTPVIGETIALKMLG